MMRAAPLRAAATVFAPDQLEAVRRGRPGQMAHFDDVPLMCMCVGSGSAPPAPDSLQPSQCGCKRKAKRKEIENEKNQIWALEPIDGIFDGSGSRCDPFLTGSRCFVLMLGLLSVAPVREESFSNLRDLGCIWAPILPRLCQSCVWLCSKLIFPNASHIHLLSSARLTFWLRLKLLSTLSCFVRRSEILLA